MFSAKNWHHLTEKKDVLTTGFTMKSWFIFVLVLQSLKMDFLSHLSLTKYQDNIYQRSVTECPFLMVSNSLAFSRQGNFFFGLPFDYCDFLDINKSLRITVHSYYM